MQRACGVTFAGDRGLYPRLSTVDNLRYFGTMYGLSGRRLRMRCDEVLDFVGLTDRARDRVELLSHGMRQRLHIARSIMHEPRILLLDEPSSGLDPQAAQSLRDLVRLLADNGRSVLLATHNLAEAEQLCQRVLILRDGHIIRAATPAQMRRSAAGSVGSCVEFEFAQSIPDAVHAARLPGRRDAGADERTVRVFCPDPKQVIAALLSLVDSGDLLDIRISGPSLHDAYLDVMAQEAVAAPTRRTVAGAGPVESLGRRT
jgi:ABC-2 type transport system ATP-binding protein